MAGMGTGDSKTQGQKPAQYSRRIREEIRTFALRQGFDAVGFAPATLPDQWPALAKWIADDHHGEMSWMARAPERRVDASHSLPGAGTVVACTVNYYQGPPGEAEWDQGVIASYARGEDYHRVLGRMLEAVATHVTENFGIPAKTYSDTGPLLEKPFGASAGVGWMGKHSNLISQTGSSWFFLGEVLLGAALETDDPKPNRCGTCDACIRACPTGAIVEPYVVDSRRCISYLTIELRTAIPRELRRGIGNRIFGCDDCQDVCPWNRFARKSELEAFLPRGPLDTMTLTEMIAMSEGEFREATRGSAIRRSRYTGFLRNVAVALGNTRDPRAVPALAAALAHESELVRSHAAWALGEIGGSEAKQLLKRRRCAETDPETLEELEDALSRLDSSRANA